MRTTLTIDDDVYRITKVLAEDKNMSIGAVVSDLVRKSFRGIVNSDHDIEGKRKNGFYTFRVSKNAKPITLEDVRRVEDELD